jgi:hypothetical protein
MSKQLTFEEENTILSNLHLTIDQLNELLPRFSRNSLFWLRRNTALRHGRNHRVSTRGRQVYVKTLTETDKEYIRLNYQAMRQRDMAEYININENKIRQFMKSEGLRNVRAKRFIQGEEKKHQLWPDGAMLDFNVYAYFNGYELGGQH